jgi:hypothetical protein
MSVDVRKFIDVNITHSNQPSIVNARDTVVLITSEGATDVKKLLTSKAEWDDYKEGKVFTNTDPYVQMFFANGGAKLLLIENASASIATTLEDKYIVIAVVGLTLNDAKTLATTFDSSLKGTHRKILLARAANADLAILPTLTGLQSLAVKYSETVGAEMTIAAYLSKIKIEGTNTVHDYSFTAETLEPDFTVPITDTLFDELSENNVNFNLNLAGSTRNIGGNMTSGYSLVNEYMLIVLHQTVTEQLLALLVTKIKGNKALSSIRTVLSQELNKYVQNGYLATNKRWTHEDWIVVHNGVEFTIIKQNTPISLGYYVQVLPWSALTANEIAAHQAPPIYIVIADSYSVRKLTLIGEVI